MRLTYEDPKFERDAASASKMQKRFGPNMAKAIMRRVKEIEAVDDVEDLFLGTGRWKRMSGSNRGDCLSARLTPNWRLIVREIADDSVAVVCIEDYH